MIHILFKFFDQTCETLMKRRMTSAFNLFVSLINCLAFILYIAQTEPDLKYGEVFLPLKILFLPSQIIFFFLISLKSCIIQNEKKKEERQKAWQNCCKRNAKKATKWWAKVPPVLTVVGGSQHFTFSYISLFSLCPSYICYTLLFLFPLLPRSLKWMIHLTKSTALRNGSASFFFMFLFV